MNTSPENPHQFEEEQYSASGIQESIQAPEEGNGPPCFGCNKPTRIQNGHFFCINKERSSTNDFVCPLQIPMGDAEVTQYIPEEIRRNAIEAQTHNFPNDEVAQLHTGERDFSFADEHPEQSFYATPPEESPFDIEIDAKDLEIPVIDLDPATQQILEMAEEHGAKTMEEVLALPDKIKGPIFEKVSYSQRDRDAEQQAAA